jgi:hypothetical protein
MGSVAEAVVRRASCPVITYRDPAKSVRRPAPPESNAGKGQ